MTEVVEPPGNRPKLVICGLLMAHENNHSALIERIKLLSSVFDEMLVHFDLKSDNIAFERLKEAFFLDSSVKIMDVRWPVYWGGDTLLRCSLDMLQYALSGSATHFISVSASHYPLNNGSLLHNFVSGLEFGDCVQHEPMSARRIIGRLVRPFDQFEKRSIWMDAPALLKNVVGLTRFWFCFGRPRFGTNWWILSRNSAQKVLRHKHLLDSGLFCRMKAIDEVFVQTILRKRGCWQPYIYSKFSKPNSGNPVSFSVRELPYRPKEFQDCIFARKVDLV